MSRKNNRKHKGTTLKRSHSHLEPRPIFYIFCEGERTEPDYFRALRNSLAPKLNINIEFPYVGAVPHTIANHAVEFKKSEFRSKRRVSSFNENDQVWAVFDRDQHPNFDEAVRLCKKNNVPVGRSNPCFEVWLILHFEDYGAQDNSQEVKKRFNKLLRDEKISQKHDRYRELVKHVEDAERRATKQMEFRCQEDNKYGNPSTTVGQLTAAIRDTNEQYLKNSRLEN